MTFHTKEKLVSTIITTYKRNESLERAITSVLNQSYNNIEVIVVDDNNEDEYRQQVKEIMGKFKENNKIKYIMHPHNMNGANARNTGLKYAKGDYITFLDDDDFFVETRFTHLVPILEKSDENYGVICSGFELFKKNKSYRTVQVSLSQNIILELLKDELDIGSGSNFIMKRKVIDEIGGFDPEFLRHQDYEFLIRVAEKFQFLTSDEVLLKIELNSKQQNKISIDRLILTKKKYLEKYNRFIDDSNRVDIMNSQLENLIYNIYLNQQHKHYKDIINMYINSNRLLPSKIKVAKLRVRAVLKRVIN